MHCFCAFRLWGIIQTLSNRIFAALMLACTIITFHSARMQFTIPYVIQVLFENDSYNRTINPDRLSLVAVSPFFMKNWDIGARTEVRDSQSRHTYNN